MTVSKKKATAKKVAKKVAKKTPSKRTGLAKKDGRGRPPKPKPDIPVAPKPKEDARYLVTAGNIEGTICVDESTLVDLPSICRILGISATNVPMLIDNNALMKSGHGKYRLVDSVIAYMNVKSGRPQNGSAEDTRDFIDYDYERARKVQEEANRLQRIRLRELNHTLDRDEYAGLLAHAVNVQKRELAALKLTLERMVPGMSAKAGEQVDKACARAHNAILDLYDTVPEIIEEPSDDE